MEIRALYHATPLHYLPHIVGTGALWSKRVLAGTGIAPRRSACRRDRMLGLSDYVHLSPRPASPLLADKIAKGYPHALLVFDAQSILDLPGAGVIPYNTKSWRHREEFRPVEDRVEVRRLLAEHTGGRHPSLEVLARYAVGLESLRFVAFINREEQALAQGVVETLGRTLSAPFLARPDLFPNPQLYRPATLADASRYFAECGRTRSALPPPAIPFD